MDFTRNKIYAVVEGHGEVGITHLIARIINERHEWVLLFPGSPVWRFSSQGDFFKPGKLEDVLRRYKARNDCAAVLVLVDMDETKLSSHQS